METHRVVMAAKMYVTDVNLDVKITNDYHIGHLIVDAFRKRRAEDICQINGETDERETFACVLHRSIRLARSLMNMGLKPGDVLTIDGPNHMDLRIPFYAGIMTGLPVCGVDPTFKYGEIQTALKLTQAKISFCQNAHEQYYKDAAKELGLDLIVVTFDKGEFTMGDLLNKYDTNKPTDDFKPPSIDIEKTFLWLVSTSGTTGTIKLAAIRHQSVLEPTKNYLNFGILGSICESGQNIGLCLSPVQWITAAAAALGFIFTNTTLLMTSKPPSVEHIIDIINKYQPATLTISPSIIALILKHEKKCDLACFDNITFVGSKIYKELITELQTRVREDTIMQMYGQTEVVGALCLSKPDSPFGSCGPVLPGRQVKLIDHNGKEVTEANVPGELYYKGPRFSEYYNNPEETANVLTEDGWLKTGDQLYRDENDNYFFVERVKMLIKYRSYHIIPPEIEEVILKHPGVMEVCVTSIEHPTDSQWPVACVVRKPGAEEVTAQEIKDLVADNLSDSKKLRGGVIFLDQLPKTSTGKVKRALLPEIAAKANRE